MINPILFLILFVLVAVGVVILPWLLPKKLRCRIGWHMRIREIGFDGCSVHAKCEDCGYEGLVDSQGNLF